MNEDFLTELLSLEFKNVSEENIGILREKLNGLLEKGYSGLKIVVLGNAAEAADFKKDEAELFNKIKEKQGLPDEVVIDFMHSKGKLAGSNLHEILKSGL